MGTFTSILLKRKMEDSQSCFSNPLWSTLKISFISLNSLNAFFSKGFKDRHQWWRSELRCSLSLSLDKLFPMAMKYVSYHEIAIGYPFILI